MYNRILVLKELEKYLRGGEFHMACSKLPRNKNIDVGDFYRWLGMLYYEKSIFDKALMFLEKATKYDDPYIVEDTLYLLGHMYEYGLGCHIDYFSAYRYYKKSDCKQGDDAIASLITYGHIKFV